MSVDLKKAMDLVPEISLISEAPDDIWALEPLRAASGGLMQATTLMTERIAAGEYETVIGDDPVKQVAGYLALLGFRAVRAIAVLASAGLSSEAMVHARRLGELAALGERVQASGGREWASEWLAKRKSASKLLARDFNSGLSTGAHAHVGHLDTIVGDADGAFLHPQRSEPIDLLLPWGATQLARQILGQVEAILELGSETSALVDTVMDRYRAAAQSQIDEAVAAAQA